MSYPTPVSDDELEQVHSGSVIKGLREPAYIARAMELPDLASLPPEVVWDAVVAPQLLAAGGTCQGGVRPMDGPPVRSPRRGGVLYRFRPPPYARLSGNEETLTSWVSSFGFFRFGFV